MRNKPFITVGELADHLNCQVLGDREKKIYGISLFQDSTETMLTYVNYKDIDKIDSIKAGAILTKMSIGLPLHRNYIICKHDPHEVLSPTIYFLIEKGLYCFPNNSMPIISKNAMIFEFVSVGNGSVVEDGTLLSSGVVIGENVKIGKNCFIGANTVIGSNTIIEDHVSIGSCCSIGTENFEYCKEKQKWSKIPVIGNVHVCNNVTIGGNVVVEKGTIGTTTIGAYTQIENLVQIGHEVQIGEHCHIVACVALAGWSEIGNYVDIYGQAAVSNHVKVGDNAILLARAGVDKKVDENAVVSGFPAQSHRKEMQFQAFLRKLFRINMKGREVK